VTETSSQRWAFRSRFRRGSFGWRSSRLAVQRVKEAVAEIKKVARSDPGRGAEGAVLFLERVSPALEEVDSSSGALGTAVYNAIYALVPLVAGAAVDAIGADAFGLRPQPGGRIVDAIVDQHRIDRDVALAVEPAGVGERDQSLDRGRRVAPA